LGEGGGEEGEGEERGSEELETHGVCVLGVDVSCWAEGERADIVEIADGQKTRINALGKERQEWSLSDFQSVGKP
jgi:hypothetical protein